jgi:hypothetical protein
VGIRFLQSVMVVLQVLNLGVLLVSAGVPVAMVVTLRSGFQLHPGLPLAPLYPSPSLLLPMSLLVAWWQLLDDP